MIRFKNLTVRNFMSVGNATQGINFNRNDLTLVLGENLDLGGDDLGARNGTGKTTIINALSYGLYGQALTNIKKDNLINKTNTKNMLVTFDFECNGIDYRIERGRKPNVLKFYVNDQEQESKDDNSQGDSRETQAEIERILGMSHDMFKHIVALNTYTEPFLSLRANDQRMIIEQLLGITILSEKAETLKEQVKATKDAIQEEEFRIKAVADANIRINEQIESLRRRQTLWQKKHSDDLTALVTEYDTLSQVDIEQELQAHQDLSAWTERRRIQDEHSALLLRQAAWQRRRDSDVANLTAQLSGLSTVDIAAELQAHADLAVYNEQVRASIEHDRRIAALKKDIVKEERAWTQLDTEVQSLKEHRCYACGQDFHDAQHAQVLDEKVAALTNSRQAIDRLQAELAVLEANPVFVSIKPVTHYATESEAVRHGSDVVNIQQQIDAKNVEVDPYAEQVAGHVVVEAGARPATHYATEREAIEHRSRVATLVEQIAVKSAETDPYAEQITEMSTTAIQETNYDTINELTRVKEHQEFLLKLLTSKDSFIRKKIIDQNLSHLNSRLGYYLDRVGLPHTVRFNNDLSVTIEELGRDLDFDNLSRGERNRLILSLSWSFRDVWESLYQPINLLFIDELVDSGMDTSGVENALAVLKKMSREGNRSVWLVSHKDELIGRVNNILRVVKENGFTNYTTDLEIV